METVGHSALPPKVQTAFSTRRTAPRGSDLHVPLAPHPSKAASPFKACGPLSPAALHHPARLKVSYILMTCLS